MATTFFRTMVRCLRAAGDAGASMFAPPCCRFCRAPLFGHSNPYLCPDCLAAIPWIGKGACRGCGYPAGPHASLGDECRRCKGGRLRLTSAAAVARYHGGARSLVLSLKFRGETEVAGPMAGLMAERLAATGLGTGHLLLPVALHPARRRERGFDQASLICDTLARLTGMEKAEGLLRRVRHTTPQASLRRTERLANMTGAFEASPKLAGRSVMLVDDVMTTGATMAECAKACRDAGARRVHALIFAR